MGVTLNYHVDDGDLIQAGEASSKMKMALRRLNLPPEVIRRASICMYEGEINMVIHACGGDVSVDVGLDSIEICMKDQGPGIADIHQAMEAGFSTAGAEARDLGFGAGMGLPNMERYSDNLVIDSVPGKGTTVHITIKM
ncbi:MAG: ATP-binding protein [Oscillospiraceae bacterium]